MQLVTKRILIAVAVVLLRDNIGSSYLRAYIEGTQGNEIARWAEHHYLSTLEALMPSGEIAPANFPRNVHWMGTVRISPPFKEREYRFSMFRTYDGKVEASITVPKEKSIVAQLEALRKEHPRASLQRIISLIKIEHRTVDQSHYPQIGDLAAQFESMMISPLLPDELMTDETGYEFWSQSLWGNLLKVHLSGPGRNAPKQPHPLLKWAEDFRKAFEP